MVEHHVQNDLDAVCIAGADQCLEFGALAVELDRCRISRVGREIADRVVAPVVEQMLAVHHALVCQLVKLKYRHQLDRVDPQLFQIRYLLHQPGKGTRMLHPRGRMPGKAAHMQLIDHHVLKRDMDIAVEIAPVEHILHHAGVVGRILRRTLAPAALSGHRAGIGIEQEFGLVKQQPARRVIRPVHPVGVLKLRDIQPEHNHRPGVADAETVGKRQHGIGLLLGAVEQAQLAAGRTDRMDGKAHTAGNKRRTVHQEQPGAHGKACDLLGSMQLAARRRWENDLLIGHGDSSFLQTEQLCFQHTVFLEICQLTGK